MLAHPWFKDVDIAKLCAFELEAPFKPSTNGEINTSYFNVNTNASALKESDIDDGRA